MVIKWTVFASKELEDIFDFIAFESSSALIARKQIKRIFKRTEQLIEMPLSGQIEPILSQFNIRYIVEGNYKILYKIENDSIIITDIFHTKRNPQKMKG